MSEPEPTLHEALAAVGWSSAPTAHPPGCRMVFDADGAVVGSMTASATWAILRDRGLHPDQRSTEGTKP